MIEDTQVDTRDLRDPQILGEELLHAAYNEENIRWHFDPANDGTRVDMPLSIIYDREVRRQDIPPFPKDHTTVQETTATYRAKMQKQAAQGDLAATRTLLDKGWALPDDMDQALLERAQEMQSVQAEVTEDVPVRKRKEDEKEMASRVCWGNGDAWYHSKHVWKNEEGEFICPGK